MDTKTKLQEAALSLFTEQGVAATTIRQIAQRAHMAEGSLYRYYVGKDDLANSLLQEIGQQIFADIGNISAETDDLESFISRLILYLAVLFDENHMYFKYIFLTPESRQGLKDMSPEAILAARLQLYFNRFNPNKDRQPAVVAAQVFRAIQNTAIFCETQQTSLSNYCESLILASLRIIKD